MASVDLLLVGREGNGKSSVGNSILRKKAFNPKSGYSQLSTDTLIKDSSIIEGRTVNIVDGLSLGDNSIDRKENVEALIKFAEKAVLSVVNGFTAFILVLKYGVRFTQQEKTVIHILRSLFGDSVIRDYGVVAMTYGDSFEKDTEDEKTTFENWCRQQTGDVRDLFKECNYRYILFNNRTKSDEQIKEQEKKLMSKLAEMPFKGTRYNINNFIEAKSSQKKLLVESKLPELQRETSTFLDDITQSLRKLDDSYYTSISCIQELTVLKAKVDKFKVYLDKEDEGTHLISHLKIQISVTESSINTKRERHERKMEYDSIIPRSKTPPLYDTTNLITNRAKFLIFLAVAVLVSILIWYYFLY